MFDRRENGTVYIQSSQPLGRYPVKLTESLVHWASVAPDRIFLAQHDSSGPWRSLTYSRALLQVRRIAQSLLNRRLNGKTPVLVLASNSIEHGLFGLACLYIGVPYVPVLPTYTLASADFLRSLHRKVQPSLVFADNADALSMSFGARTELVAIKVSQKSQATPFEALSQTKPGPEVEEAHSWVTADTVAKILLTSGSTDTPKGVITTQRMLCSNQQMIRTAMPFLADEQPVLCDWLPWHHVFGGSHNFGITLYNGGSLYIDEGKPTASSFGATLNNLREIAPTAYFNVPKGYPMLLSALKGDPTLRRNFFSRLKVLFCAGAMLPHDVWVGLQNLALTTRGEKILLMNALGATESGPMALATISTEVPDGKVGLPVPAVELKLVPWRDKFEARLRGPNITPGYWRDLKTTAASFDEEGFYRLGDALQFVDSAEPLQGLCFAGRIGENFKLSTGTWVNAGEMREQLLAHLQGMVLDVVITAPDRDYIGALLFLPPGLDFVEVRIEIIERLNEFAFQHSGLSTRVQRALIVEEPPLASNGELTVKGTINQQIALLNRAALVEELYAGSGRVLEFDQTSVAE